MGNSQATERSRPPPSGTTAPKMSENAEMEGDEETELDDSDFDVGIDLDFSHLFRVEDIHIIASKLRDSEKTIYECCYQELKEALETVENRVDLQVINFSRFCDMLKSLNLDHADLLRIFNLFDYEGRGSFEVKPALQELKKNKKIAVNDDLNLTLQRFDECSWTPGFVDVYVDQKDGFKQLGTSIFDFLLRNRLPVSAANCQTVELFEATCKLREKIVRSRIKSLELSGSDVAADLESKASSSVQTKPILKKEDNVSEDRLLPDDARKQEPELPQDEMHSGEALLLWYIQLVTTTARACLPLAPELMGTALTHTRAMVSRLLPLSLSHDSVERPPFLNADCFREMGSLIQLFPEKAELLNLSLSFHLVCGSVSEILQSLIELNASMVQIDCSKLLSKIDRVRRRLLDENSHYLKVKLLGCDAERTPNQDPHSVLETNWKQSAFSTKPGQTKVNFVFECSNWAEITKIKIKVESDKSAPSFGFVFVLAEWPGDMDASLKKELEKFSMYDNWNESDYKSRGSKRSIGGSSLTSDPVAYFSTKNSNEVNVVLDNPASGKFIVVKFLEPRETDADHLGIVGIKFYGVQRSTAISLLEQQISRRLLNAEQLESNQLAIQAVLRFLLLVFCRQAKKQRAVSTDTYNFREANFVTVDQKTGLVVNDPPTYLMAYLCSLIAKMPFSKDCPYFELEIDSHGNEGSMCVGAVSRKFEKTNVPGRVANSYGYMAFNGLVGVDGDITESSEVCKTGDKIGCGVEFQDEKIMVIYFTRNGERIYKSNVENPAGELFPAVALRSRGERIRLLNKEPWRFSNKPAEKVKISIASMSDFVNPKHLDLSYVTIDTLWTTYRKFPDELNQGLILQLIHSVLPQLKPDSNYLRSTSEIFDHLCHLLDQKNTDEEEDIKTRSAKDLIKDGLVLFLPCKETRPKMLLDLLEESSKSSLTGSKLVLFQSLCHYFSTADLNALVPLPDTPSHLPQNFNSSSLCTVMEKLFSVSFRDSLGLFQSNSESDGSTLFSRFISLGNQLLSGRKKSEHLADLVKLFNQLQARLLAWVCQQLSESPEAGNDGDRLENLVIDYCSELITPKAEYFLTRMKMLSDSDLRVLLPELDTSFLATTLPELVLLLSELSVKLSSQHKLKLLETLKPLLMTIRKLLFKVPDLVPSLGENQGGKPMEKELRSWEVDSPLTNRPSDIDLRFSCAGASRFEVEFDRRCETERSYETLEFTDMRGNQRQFSGQVGSNSWPLNVRFENTSTLFFVYHKEIRSSAAGYNFKVKAMQTLLSDFHWLYDLYLSFCRLFGRISGSVLDKTPVLPKSATSQEKLELQMYRSELWKTIFRGGLVVIKKFERSLSGNYETADQSDVAAFLSVLAEFKSEKAKFFINRCKSHQNRNHSVGGEEIDRVIASVFAALLWHTQSLRHDVSIYLRNEFDGKISDGIHEAFAAAENLRLFLAEKRQTMKKEIEERQERGEEEEGKEKEAVVDVVHLVEEKSKFLLQFAGLSRVALKAEEFKRKYENRRSRPQSVNRLLSHEPSVDLSITVESKYPSFRLVFDFIQDMAWTKDKVEDLLKKRYINSENLWKTYSFMSEFFRTVFTEHLENDMSCMTFMRELLASQEKFGRHYADGIDGCGLSMEAKVRSSYYGLLRQLVTVLKKDLMASSDKSKPVGFEVMATGALHLLDIDWQAYDLPFLVELRLPELYFTLAKDYLPPVFEKTEEFGVDETEEEYRRNLELVKEAHRDIYAFYQSRYNGTQAWLAKHIVARYHKVGLSTSYMCDGCHKSVSTDYYRCLDCFDVDICKTCYENGNLPDSMNHSGEHSLILFRYLCRGCNGFITGTRWHCSQCNDFDLCNGCHVNNNFPEGSGHSSDHSVSTFPTPKVCQSKKATIKGPMNAYFHLHGWMLYCNVALSALNFLLSKASDEKVQKVDESYVFSARQLYSMCLEGAVEYLVSGLSSTDELDSARSTMSYEAEATAGQTNSSGEASELRERSLVSKSIGLIAALIPSNNQSPAVKEVLGVLSSEKFLMALFDIARAEKLHDTITCHMALGLLGKLLQQMNITSEASQSVKSLESGDVMIVDPKAVNLIQSLFSFGADCLKRFFKRSGHVKRHGLELAKSTSLVLNELQKNPTWTQLLTHQFSVTLDMQQGSPTMPLIFALFAFTGFPEKLTVGTLVTHLDKDKEVIRSVVRCKESDDATCTIVELASRKKKQMKDILLDVVANEKSFLTDNQVSQFVKLITDVVNQKVLQDLTLDAQTLWLLSLVIKASLQSVQISRSAVNLQLYENAFLQCLGHLASLGTGLSKNLLIRDLEILSLELNKLSQMEPSVAAAESDTVAVAGGEDVVEAGNVDAGNNDADDDNDDDVASSSEEEDNHESRRHSLVFVMTEDQARELRLSRVVLDEEGRDSVLRETGHAKKRQKSCKKGEIDTGVGIGQHMFDLLNAEIEIDECVEEANPEKPCLILTSEDEDKDAARKRKEKSLHLAKKMCSSKKKGLLAKVNRALAILNARQLLMALVSECPEEKAVEFFKTGGPPESRRIISIFFILHLLRGLEADKTLEKVIRKLVNSCQPDDIVYIAVASGFFVASAEGQLVTVSKQLPAPLLSESGEGSSSSSSNFMDEVYIPGATALKVQLDKSSCAECDVELVFASSSDMTKNKQCFSGQSSENWEDFTINGDHLYCTLSGPDLTSVSSSYKFKVTGILSFSDRFDVGYLALCAIFDKPETVRLLPVGHLWKLLVGMANRSAKTQRLKTIQLLLKLMSLQTRSHGCEQLSVDLGLLKGLWQMYEKMVEATKDSKEVQPALVLALTELFFIAENVAKEWNVVNNFITSVVTDGSTSEE